MRVLDGLDALRKPGLPDDPSHDDPGHLEARSAVCVGVFDGVHLGHQRLMHELLEMASELAAVPTVVTFRAHPDALLRGRAPPLLVSVPHRLRLLRRCGVERVLLLDFDARVRELTAERFAREILAQGLHTVGLLLGYDSAVGKDRGGTPERLRALGQELGFAVRVAAPFTVDGKAVSSTRIRAAISGGDLAAAHRLLGRWPSAFGSVVRGDGRGRKLGYPTANVDVQTPVLPPSGVYAVEVLHDGEPYLGVANLGTRPTFGDGNAGAGAPASAATGATAGAAGAAATTATAAAGATTAATTTTAAAAAAAAAAATAATAILEVHLLDFSGDLYGATLEVCFRARLRDERRFATPAELVAQIERDVARARELLVT